MAAKPSNQQFEVSVEVDGEKHTGSFYVNNGMIYVSYGFGSKSTQVRGMSASTLARVLLAEIVKEEKGNS